MLLLVDSPPGDAELQDAVEQKLAQPQSQVISWWGLSSLQPLAKKGRLEDSLAEEMQGTARVFTCCTMLRHDLDAACAGCGHF